MIKDARRALWGAAEKAGRVARAEDEPLTSNPYQPGVSKEEAALFFCWRRGWMDVDRELATQQEKDRQGRRPEPVHKKVVAL